MFVREWFTGRIAIEPLPDGGLMAHWNENAAALLRAANLGSSGSGGVIRVVFPSWIRAARKRGFGSVVSPRWGAHRAVPV